MRDKIIEIITDAGLDYKERERTIHTTCPECGKDDKLSILKANGAVICYRGSCGFKGFLENWTANTLGIPLPEAREKVKGGRTRYGAEIEDLDAVAPPPVEPGLTEIEWPPPYLVPIGSQYFTDGLEYLKRRGVSQQTAEKYGILYCPPSAPIGKVWTDRVYLPVRRQGKTYGFQARAVKPTEDKLRMLNNQGFRRDVLVMFEDNLARSGHAIICEGPFDAIKFDVCGGAVATMGKVVTEKQLEIIKSYRPKKVYLALDDDADQETRKLIKAFTVPVYLVSVPRPCVDRCKEQGRKADFGECTPQECYQAFEEAELVDETTLVLSL